MDIEEKRPPNTSTDVRLCTSVMLSPDLYAVVPVKDSTCQV